MPAAARSCPSHSEPVAAVTVGFDDWVVVSGPTFALVVVVATDDRRRLGSSACYCIRHGGRHRDDRRDGCYNLDFPYRHGGCSACRRPSSYLSADYIIAKILVAAV